MLTTILQNEEFERYVYDYIISIMNTSKDRRGAYNTFANIYNDITGQKLDKYYFAVLLNQIALDMYSDCKYRIRKEYEKSREEYPCPNKNDWAPLEQLNAIKEITENGIKAVTKVRSMREYVNNAKGL